MRKFHALRSHPGNMSRFHQINLLASRFPVNKTQLSRKPFLLLRYHPHTRPENQVFLSSLSFPLSPQSTSLEYHIQPYKRLYHPINPPEATRRGEPAWEVLLLQNHSNQSPALPHCFDCIFKFV